jgi:2-haloacid dehalogenase
MTVRRRPLAVAFDVVETLFSLDAVEAALAEAGPGAPGRDLFFNRLLRDGFALAASDGYWPFREVADSALAATSNGLDAAARARVLAAFSRLDAHPDARPALARVRAAGLPVATLTNGSAAVTQELLDRSGLADLVDRVISVDEAQAWKPAPAPYRRAAEQLGVVAGQLALVAVHAWDVHGACRAGLVTGWASRLEGRFPPIFDHPDVTGANLVEVVDGLLALPAGPTDAG